jgi:hypothetical protein
VRELCWSGDGVSFCGYAVQGGIQRLAYDDRRDRMRALKCVAPTSGGHVQNSALIKLKLAWIEF